LNAGDAQDLEEIAEGFRHRHRRTGHSHRHGGTSGVASRKFYLPAVSDPSIWAVKCKPGKEREVLYSLMKRLEQMEHTRTPLQISSAFERRKSTNSQTGYIYVEARSAKDVQNALLGIQDVYAGGNLLLV